MAIVNKYICINHFQTKGVYGSDDDFHFIEGEIYNFDRRINPNDSITYSYNIESGIILGEEFGDIFISLEKHRENKLNSILP